MSDNLPTRFTDERARAVLARAIEIDSRAPMTTAEDLRLIAAELGVSTASLEAAMREETTSLESMRMVRAQRAGTRIAAMGVPLGVTAGALISSGAILSSLGIMAVGLVASGGLVIYQSATGSLRSFHIKNTLLWAGVWAGSAASLALLGDGVGIAPTLITAGWTLRSWIASGILGSAGLIAVRRGRRSEGDDADAGLTAATTRPGSNRWIRLARRILGSMVRPLRSALRVPVANR
jgi:hypothetical protein